MADDINNSSKGGGYGKRPVWQWVAIYLLVAVVVYGAIYYFFMKDSGDSSSSSIY